MILLLLRNLWYRAVEWYRRPAPRRAQYITNCPDRRRRGELS